MGKKRMLIGLENFKFGEGGAVHWSPNPHIGSPLSDSPDLVLVANVSSLKLAWLPYRRRVNEEG